METSFCTEERLRKWYKRVMQVPAITDETGCYFTCAAAQLKKTNRLYPDSRHIYLPPEEFNKKFYPAMTALRN